MLYNCEASFPKVFEILYTCLTNQHFWGCACTPCNPSCCTTVSTP